MTDVQGTTRLAYHATRGVVDSIVTPYADTLSYAIDAWGRAVGPRVAHSSDPDFAVTQAWDDVGEFQLVAASGPAGSSALVPALQSWIAEPGTITAITSTSATRGLWSRGWSRR